MILSFASTEQIIVFLVIEKEIDHHYSNKISFLGNSYSVDEFLGLLKKHQILKEKFRIVIGQLQSFSIENKTWEKIPDGFEFDLDRFNHLKTGKSIYGENHNYKLLSIEDACKMLNISRPTLYKLINSEDIPLVKIGNDISKIQMIDILNFIRRSKKKK